MPPVPTIVTTFLSVGVQSGELVNSRLRPSSGRGGWISPPREATPGLARLPTRRCHRQAAMHRATRSWPRSLRAAPRWRGCRARSGVPGARLRQCPVPPTNYRTMQRRARRSTDRKGVLHANLAGMRLKTEPRQVGLRTCGGHAGAEQHQPQHTPWRHAQKVGAGQRVKASSSFHCKHRQLSCLGIDNIPVAGEVQHSRSF